MMPLAVTHVEICCISKNNEVVRSSSDLSEKVLSVHGVIRLVLKLIGQLSREGYWLRDSSIVC